MKINYYALASRSLIALLFVFAGFGKLMGFAATSAMIAKLGVPLAPLATIIVILIELPVALAFAWGYKTRETGYALIAFTVLATLLAHRDFTQQMNIIMVLKNLAIVGGIMAAISCACKDCVVHHVKKS